MICAALLTLGSSGCQTTLASHRADRSKSDLERAEIALARGDVDEASRLFEQCLEFDPDDPRALGGSARAYLAAGRGVDAVDRFAAYRRHGGAWRRAEHHDHCQALGLAVVQVLDAGQDPEGANALAHRIAAEKCNDQPVEALVLRSGLQLADREKAAGRHERALELYRGLVEPNVQPDPPNSKPGVDVAVRYDDPYRAQAYLESSRLLLDSGRRAEALAMLSRGLDELPGNRDLVHLMVTVLAEGSDVVFPREKPPGSQVPAAPH